MGPSIEDAITGPQHTHVASGSGRLLDLHEMNGAGKTASPTTTVDRPAGVDRIFDAAELPEQSEHVALATRSGRSVAIAPDGAGDRLTIRGPSGELELTIRLTAEGPVITLAGASIELTSSRDVTIECERFAVHAREGAELVSGGDVREQIAGEREVVVGGKSRVEAHSASVEARRGNVELKANDDVVVDGERIYLNR
jgi:hypothetical protein